MDLIKLVFVKSYIFIRAVKCYIINNKRYLPIIVLYFYFFTWIFSIFPKIILIYTMEVLTRNRLSIDWIENTIMVVISVIFVWNFIKAIQIPLEKNLEIEPLFKRYPELENEIIMRLGDYTINKNVEFYIRDSEELNAKAISNLYEGIIILNSSIMNFQKDEIIAVIAHELYHIKNWSTLFISEEIWKISIKVHKFICKVNQKANENKIAKFLAVNLFTELLQITAILCLVLLNIFSCFYRVFIDEMLADKYSVDSTKSKSIANVFRMMPTEDTIDDDNPFNLIINKTHLPPSFRYILIDKYHYWKYIKPCWKRNRIIIISKVIGLIVSCIMLFIFISALVPFLIKKTLFILASLWKRIFWYDESTSMLAFILLVSAIGWILNGIKLYKSLRRLDSIKRRLKYGSLTCVFLCLFFLFLFIIFNCKNLINLYIGLFFGLIFIVLGYLYEKYDNRNH